jgi:hypothetical protein
VGKSCARRLLRSSTIQLIRRRRVALVGVTVAGVVAALVTSVLTAGPAWAKGPERLTITGPGLDQPIEIQLSGPGSKEEETPSYLVVALIELANLYYVGPEVELASDPPPRNLKDGYRVTWLMSQPPNADPADYTVVQDLYPDVGGGPVVHTHPSAYTGGAGGWYRAAPGLRGTLAAMGVPVSGLPLGLSSQSPARVRAAEPEQDHSSTLLPVPVAGTIGLALGIGIGVALMKHRRPRSLSSL